MSPRRRLTHADPATYRDARGGKSLGVKLDGVDRAGLRALIEEAWSLAAAKQLRDAVNLRR